MWSPLAKQGSFAPVLILALAGCSTHDAAQIVQPLETTLGTAVPAAFLAATAMSSLGGTPSPCVSVVPQGSTDGGQSVQVNVQLGPGCPKPFVQTQGGTAVVTGVWTPTLGVFLADFTGVPQGTGGLLVEKIAVMTVVPSSSHLLVGYMQQGVAASTGATPSAELGQTAWALDVNTNGTADPTDDTLTISGGDQSLLAAASGNQAETADATQVALADVVFQAGCRKNPQSGIAAVQRAGNLGGGWMLFTFHSACDGRVDVTAAMAPYELMIGQSVPLAFLQP